MQSAIAKENSSEQQAAPAFQEGNDQLLNAKIVIVDDESTTMEVVKAYLEETGYRNFVLIEESPWLPSNDSGPTCCCSTLKCRRCRALTC